MARLHTIQPDSQDKERTAHITMMALAPLVDASGIQHVQKEPIFPDEQL
jgi:hypothetical protein